MKYLRLLIIVCACLVGMAPFAAAQYVNPSNPNYGFTLGTCYSPSVGKFISLAPTAANLAAYAQNCDGQGNLQPIISGQTVTTAAPGNLRTIVGTVTTSNASYANGGSSIVGVRGAATIPSGTTATTGYVYGTQGKAIIQGTLNGSVLWIAGTMGQLDISAGTLTSGAHLTPMWSDAGATGPSVNCTFCDSLVLTNTTSTTFHSLIFGYSKASYFADLTDISGTFSNANTSTSGTVAGYIKLHLNGADVWLRVYTLGS
jgi:hypothetical protein